MENNRFFNFIEASRYVSALIGNTEAGNRDSLTKALEAIEKAYHAELQGSLLSWRETLSEYFGVRVEPGSYASSKPGVDARPLPILYVHCREPNNDGANKITELLNAHGCRAIPGFENGHEHLDLLFPRKKGLQTDEATDEGLQHEATYVVLFPNNWPEDWAERLDQRSAGHDMTVKETITQIVKGDAPAQPEFATAYNM